MFRIVAIKDYSHSLATQLLYCHLWNSCCG